MLAAAGAAGRSNEKKTGTRQLITTLSTGNYFHILLNCFSNYSMVATTIAVWIMFRANIFLNNEMQHLHKALEMPKGGGHTK